MNGSAAMMKLYFSCQCFVLGCEKDLQAAADHERPETGWTLGQVAVMKMDRLCTENFSFRRSLVSCWLCSGPFYSRSWKQRVCLSFVKGSFLSPKWILNMWGPNSASCSSPGAEAAQVDHWSCQERKMSAFSFYSSHLLYEWTTTRLQRPDHILR